MLIGMRIEEFFPGGGNNNPCSESNVLTTSKNAIESLSKDLKEKLDSKYENIDIEIPQ